MLLPSTKKICLQKQVTSNDLWDEELKLLQQFLTLALTTLKDYLLHMTLHFIKSQAKAYCPRRD